MLTFMEWLSYKKDLNPLNSLVNFTEKPVNHLKNKPLHFEIITLSASFLILKNYITQRFNGRFPLAPTIFFSKLISEKHASKSKS